MRLFMFILGVAALVYMEPGSESPFHGWLLPAVALLGVGYAFWLGGFVAIVVGVLAFRYTDIDADSVLQAVLLPLLLGGSAIYFIWWAGPGGGGLIDDLGDAGGCNGDGDGGGCGGGD